jgi:hypothetical protein
MYICSAVLFLSSITLLYIGIKKCSKTIGTYTNYCKLLYILKQNSNEDFIDHHFIQTDINKEIINGNIIKSN